MRRQHNRLYCLIASFLLCLAADIAPAAAEESAPAFVSIQPSEPSDLPALALFDLAGNPVTPDFGKHKLTILHFWAGWCVPCLKELPDLDRLYGAYKEKGLNVLAVSLDGGKPERAVEFFSKLKIQSLSPIFDRSNAALRAVKGGVLPLSVFVSPAGKEISRGAGAVNWESPETRAFIENALK